MTASLRLAWKLLVFPLLVGSFFWSFLPAQAHLEQLLQGWRWRFLGPQRGGRVTAVAGVEKAPLVYFMGTTGGGVFKTTDGGLSWRPISDGFLKTGSVGALSVSSSNPRVLYVGMGECCLRNDISPGDGIYKSLDGGRTFLHMGLANSRHVARICIHPGNPELVYAAVLGHVHGPRQGGGVFRSRNGGQSWERVLDGGEQAGAADLVMDARHPKLLLAALWQVRALPWGIFSGGPASGLYKTSDGGASWVQLKVGLPTGKLGRIGCALSPPRPERMWALVEAQKGGLFRSEDGGAHWRLINQDFQLRRRPAYYSHLTADPKDPDTLYVASSRLLKSTDGGLSFHTLRVPHGDTHALWIDPADTQRMINGNDGGATVSRDGGRSWSTEDNQPTGQFYHVIADDAEPYRLYGCQQDQGSLSISSGTGRRSRGEPPYSVGAGESGYLALDPHHPEVVFGGSYWGRLTRYDHLRREVKNISMAPDLPLGRPAAALKLRFNWTFPVLLSRHAPHTLFVGAQKVFKSENGGQGFEVMSPDLTRNDKGRQEAGRLTQIYDTLTVLAESPLSPGELWAGSDDGLLHVSRDAGLEWKNVTPKGLPPWSRITSIEVSPHDAATVYVAANRFDQGDLWPYLYRTRDGGRTWKSITAGIPKGSFLRVVRADQERPGLLYAGTETGVFISLDSGDHWQRLGLNLPAVPVHDLILWHGDLVLATHGRGLVILDDITPLQQLRGETLVAPVHLFRPRDAVRHRGVVVRIRIFLKEPVGGRAVLEILDQEGRLMRRFKTGGQTGGPGPRGDAQLERCLSRAGLRTFIWDGRYPPARGLRGGTWLFQGGLRGPVVLPGSYQVRFRTGGRSYQQSFRIRRHPLLLATQEDLQAELTLLQEIRDSLSQTHEVMNRVLLARQKLLRVLQTPIGNQEERLLGKEAARLDRRLEALSHPLAELGFRGIDDQMLVHPLQLNARLAALAGSVASADAKPTDQAEETFRQLQSELETVLKQLRPVLEEELPAFLKQVSSASRQDDRKQRR